MGLVQAVNSCFSKYVNFSGRAPRAEFWWWYLFYLIVVFAALLLDTLLVQKAQVGGAYVYVITSIVLFLPTIAVGARRLHDTDRSGWLLLVCFVPLIGIILLLIWLCTAGQPGTNRFGANPYGL